MKQLKRISDAIMTLVAIVAFSAFGFYHHMTVQRFEGQLKDKNAKIEELNETIRVERLLGQARGLRSDIGLTIDRFKRKYPEL